MDPFRLPIAVSTAILILSLILFSQNVPAIKASAKGVSRFKCEDLQAEKCAFAVTSNGSRCILEKTVRRNGASDYKCQTSTVAAERPRQWIESEMCIRVCGLQRLSVGFSTDGLHEYDFTNKLCLSDCRIRCPNINDLYTKLAEGEGIKLDDLCDSVKRRMKRLMAARQQRRQQEQELQRIQERKERRAQAPPVPKAPVERRSPVSLAPTPAPLTAPSPIASGLNRGAATNSPWQPPGLSPASTGLDKSPAAPTPSSSGSDDLDDDWFASPAPSSTSYLPTLPPVLPPAIVLPPPLPRHHFPFPFPHFGNFPPTLGT